MPKLMSTQPSIKYGFVVLHYNNFVDTISCVNSILRINYKAGFHIVIVDNASPNQSFSILQNEFNKNPNVDLILSDTNNGYSSGNNIGIKFLREAGINQVIIATNDTEVLSQDLLDVFDSINMQNVGIVGTDVITPKGEHQNPPLLRPTLLYFLNLYCYAPMAWLREFVYCIFPVISSSRVTAGHAEKVALITLNSLQLERNVYMLHGCFLYLTSKFLDKAGLLDESLFMYGEEDLMSWNCERHGLKRLYLPTIKILHKDGKSTKDFYKESRDEFVRTMTIKSKKYLARNIGMWCLLKVVLRYKCEK